ncbi:MAG: topoisomerase DNA-binding C4 zinc finger domain-containing protein [Anaerolineae bacterium]|nr:topoisomerase DNA-binding C4 zinc finger domain-containing protein [Phycisphaerae bacterium]
MAMAKLSPEDKKQIDALTPLLKEGAAESADMIAKILAENPSLTTTAAGPKYPITTDIDCDECGKPMIIRKGRRGPFLGCSGYPKCKNTGEVPAKLIEEMGLNGNGEKNGEAKTDPIPLPEPTEHEDAA